MIAALYVQRDGCYWGVPGIDAWDEERDARFYRGPHPVIAHPPCQRWGRYWHGSPRKPHQYKLGDDGGCFAAALRVLTMWGGVLEHPAYSKAWEEFDLPRPSSKGGWTVRDGFAACHVEQGHYGHMACKKTWLLACHLPSLPPLRWGAGEQRLHPVALERHGYAKARRIGVMAMVGGKDKTRIREATPGPFRDLLIDMVRPLAGAS